MDIRDRINAVIAQNPGMTVRSVSLAAGLSDSALHKFLTGGTESVTLKTVDKLAEALNVDPAWLAYGKGERPTDAGTVKSSAAKPRHYLREWRAFRKMTLIEVADALGMTHGNVSKIERGLVPYSQQILETLAECFDTEPSSLISRDPSERETDILAIWSRISERDRPQARRVLRALIRD